MHVYVGVYACVRVCACVFVYVCLCMCACVFLCALYYPDISISISSDLRSSVHITQFIYLIAFEVFCLRIHMIQSEY